MQWRLDLQDALQLDQLEKDHLSQEESACLPVDCELLSSSLYPSAAAEA